jgi:hypothetical protein
MHCITPLQIRVSERSGRFTGQLPLCRVVRRAAHAQHTAPTIKHWQVDRAGRVCLVGRWEAVSDHSKQECKPMVAYTVAVAFLGESAFDTSCSQVQFQALDSYGN